MQRVTSRQRLFSWDQFDAAVPSSDEEGDDTQSEYETCVSMSRHASLIFKNSQSFENVDNDSTAGIGLELSNECDDALLDESLTSEPIPMDLNVIMIPTNEMNFHSPIHSQHQQLRKRDVHGMKKSISISNLVLEDARSTFLVDPPMLHQESSCYSAPTTRTRNITTMPVEEKKQPQLPPIAATAAAKTMAECLFKNLHLDMQLSILEFLDLTSLRALKLSCSQMHNLFSKPQEEDALKTSIWCPLMQQQWPELSLFKLPSTTHFQVQSKDTPKTYGTNTPYATVLPHVSPIPLMTHMMSHDPTLFSSHKMERPIALDDGIVQKEFVSVLTFVGSTGLGDRSLVSNQPFPLPLKSLPADPKSETVHSSLEDAEAAVRAGAGATCETQHCTNSRNGSAATITLTSPTTFLKRWRRSNCSRRGGTVDAVYDSIHQSFVSKFGSNYPSIPFVSPFVSRVNEIDLTPRRSAYFEVSILSRPDGNEPNNDSHRRPGPVRLERQLTPENINRSTECVAVGLSLPGYATVGRMPGWDSLSYGYHGDDGGLFHSKGDMLRTYGPTYGAGDTVGCGIQYDTGGIFFTKNGEWLGYAWTKEPVVLAGTTKLYPTVGVDSQCPISCNFGTTRPFVFNFAKFVGMGPCP